MRVALIALALAGCGSDGKAGGTADSGVTGSDTDSPPTGSDTTDTDPTDSVPTDTDTETTPVATGCYDVPLEVTGGFGADAFTPLADGDTVTMTHGVQSTGAFHLETPALIASTHETVSVLTTVTLTATGQVISGLQGAQDNNTVYLALVLSGECAGTAVGVRSFLNDVVPVEPDAGVLDSAQSCALDGQEATITWSVTDLTDGRTGEDSVTVVLARDPFDDQDGDGDGYTWCEGDCRPDDGAVFPGQGC